MYKGYKEGEQNPLSVYVDLLQKIEFIETSLQEHNVADLLVLILAKVGVLLEVISMLKSLDDATKTLIKNTINKQLIKFLEYYNQIADTEDGK